MPDMSCTGAPDAARLKEFAQRVAAGGTLVLPAACNAPETVAALDALNVNYRFSEFLSDEAVVVSPDFDFAIPPCAPEPGLCEFKQNPEPNQMTEAERAHLEHIIAYTHGETDTLPPDMESIEALAARVRREMAGR